VTRLTLRLFGPPRLELDGAPVETDRRKALALLAYLAVTKQSHSREALAALFWPDYDQSRAYAYLRRTLWEINQAVGEGWVLADRETVGLIQDADPSTGSGRVLWLDVAEFQSLLAECRKANWDCATGLPVLAEAATLYQDHFLAGFSLKDAPGFDEWVFFQAEGLRRDLAGALETLVRCHSEQGKAEAALPFARRWLVLDSLNEAAHRRLMQLYEQAGRRSAALRQYQECVRVLQEELGAAPQPETTALYERIRAGEQEGTGTAEKAPVAPLSTAPAHNFPAQLTRFIGRADELAQIAALLSNPECRLLTLTGPGGVGKTRIALKAAEAHMDAFLSGVFFVPLAPVGDPAFIVSAIADAVGFSFFSQTMDDDQPMQKRQLLNFLGQKHILLVLDNFEHLLSGVSLLTDALRAAPQVKILATSRERFNLQEEWVLTIGGMHVPTLEPPEEGAEALGEAGRMEAYNAVQLFVQNARRSVVGFTLTEAERPHVIRICQLVEGLPLALELAAAWVKTLSCREIAEEIERSVDFLTTPLRNVPERHQSLRAVFEYSWALLTAPEQDAFRRLSVFHGGFEREAALAVAGAPLPLLAALVDKSLLYHRGGRYEWHEVLRQYAAEKLDAAPEDKAQTFARHSAHYAEFVRARESSLRGHGQKQALEEIGAEIENIRAGWRWAVAQRDAARVTEYLDGLCWFCDMRGRFQEVTEMLEQALTALQPQADATEAGAIVVGRLLAWQGWFSGHFGRFLLAQERFRQSLAVLRRHVQDFRHGTERARGELALVSLQALLVGAVTGVAEAQSLAKETIAYYRGQNDRWGIAQILSAFGWGAQGRDDVSRARSLFQEALQIQREIGDDVNAARTLNWLGELAHHAGEYAEARQCYQDSLSISRDLGDRWATSLSLDYSGYVARRMGDHAEARRLHQESLAISREVGDQQGVAGSLDNLGLVAYDIGDYTEAQRLFEEGLALRRAAGEAFTIAISLEHVAGVALAVGDDARAEQALQESLGLVPDWAYALIRLGDLRLAQRNPLEALEHYRQALQIAMRRHDLPVMLDSLTGIAALRAQTGETARAAELLAFILNHPASEYATRSKARRLFDEVSVQLPPESLAEADARARAETLEAVVASV